MFVPIDDTTAFAQQTLTLLKDPRPHRPDTSALEGEWDRYEREFLDLVATGAPQ